MPTINITVKNKRAVGDGSCVVCDNSDYIVNVNFDAEWSDYEIKTMRIKFTDGTYYEDVFSGNSCALPVINNQTGIEVGFYAGNLKTTTGAYFDCKKSILYGSGTHTEPPEDVYNQLVELADETRDIAQSVRDDANNGKFTPVRGVDYWTEADKTEIVDDVIATDEIQQLNIAEQERISNENARIAAENERQSAENARAESEAERQQSEKSRVKAETERASAENNRQLNESARNSAETARTTAEESRASAESERQSNEAVRAGAENTRISAENERAAAEAVRQENEAKRQDAYNGKADIIILESQTAKMQSINDGGDYPLVGMNIYGNSVQDGTPTPNSPVNIVSASPTIKISHLTNNHIFTVPAAYPMRAVDCDGTIVADEFKLSDDGKVYHIQKIWSVEMSKAGNFVADGTNRYSIYASSGLFAFNDTTLKTANAVMCTHFAHATSGYDRIQYRGVGQVRISVTTNTFLTADALNEFMHLPSNNVIIQYPMSDPITTEITDSTITEAIKALSTYLGTTKITCDNLCKIKYRADTTAAFNNLLAKINELQSAVITLGGTT